MLSRKEKTGFWRAIGTFFEAKSDPAHFFAVGAAHYTGDTAIQDLLKKKGYTITPRF